jgi:tetratricopeptide (TPR) repeat protein
MATAVVERPDNEVRALRDRIANSPPPEALELLELPRTYILGLLDARLDELSSALATAEDLSGRDFPPELAAEFGSTAPDLALSLRARVAHARGEPQSALEFVRSQTGKVSYSLTRGFSMLSRGYDRYLVATILQSQGDHEGALAWYESIEGHSIGDLPFLAPSHLRRAEIYEEMGDRDRAALQYAEALKLWADAEPEYQPMVEAARNRLRALMPDS